MTLDYRPNPRSATQKIWCCTCRYWKHFQFNDAEHNQAKGSSEAYLDYGGCYGECDYVEYDPSPNPKRNPNPNKSAVLTFAVVTFDVESAVVNGSHTYIWDRLVYLLLLK